MFAGRIKQGPLDNLLWRARRQWHRWFPEYAMRRRKLLVALAGLAAVLVVTGTTALAGLGVVVAAAAIVFALWPEPPSRITGENFDRMRRRKLLLALAGLAVVVAAGVVVLWPRPEPITQENCDRIRTGMSRAEVEEILGLPGDYRTGPGATNLGRDVIAWVIDPDVHPYPPSSWSKLPEGPHSWGYWLGDSFQISVAIDDSGHVQEMHGFPRRTTQGIFANLLWRTKRQWHRWFPD